MKRRYNVMACPNISQNAVAVADHYDELDAIYRRVWVEHVHHGLWATGRPHLRPKSSAASKPSRWGAIASRSSSLLIVRHNGGITEPSACELDAWRNVQRFQGRPLSRVMRDAGEQVASGAAALGKRAMKYLEERPGAQAVVSCGQEMVAKGAQAMGAGARKAADAVHRLGDALQRAGELDDTARIFLPLQASEIVESVNKPQGQIAQFVNVTKGGPLSWVEARDQGWGNTVVSVAQQIGAAIGGAVAGLFGGLRNVTERALLEQAKRIEADRAGREKPENPGRNVELSSPDSH